MNNRKIINLGEIDLSQVERMILSGEIKTEKELEELILSLSTYIELNKIKSIKLLNRIKLCDEHIYPDESNEKDKDLRTGTKKLILTRGIHCKKCGRSRV